MTSSHSGADPGSAAEIPKAFEAFLAWRWFSREIEADFLRFYRVDIIEWYAGTVDSRRFLALLDGLPDESLFKTWAVRKGDWSESQYVAARAVNEIALSRADGKGYMPELVRSPLQMADEQATSEYRRAKHSENLRQLEGDDDGDNR